jgi:hypothetical protein
VAAPLPSNKSQPRRRARPKTRGHCSLAPRAPHCLDFFRIGPGRQPPARWSLAKERRLCCHVAGGGGRDWRGDQERAAVEARPSAAHGHRAPARGGDLPVVRRGRRREVAGGEDAPPPQAVQQACREDHRGASVVSFSVFFSLGCVACWWSLCGCSPVDLNCLLRRNVFFFLAGEESFYSLG